MGFGVSFFGNSPEFITAAISRQLKEGYELATQSDLAGEVAQMIHELTGVERVIFTNTGTEAVMNAMRIARTQSGKTKIVVFKGYYHGTFDGLLARADGNDALAVPLAPGTPAAMLEDLVLLNYGTEESLAYIEEHASELAAVMLEPVQSRRPGEFPQTFIHRLRALTTGQKVLLIFDEIITGFRIQAGGVQELLGIQADIVTYGKVLGGGMPIGVIAGRKACLDSIDGGWWTYGDDSYPKERMTLFGGTFCRHPLALAAAKAVLLRIKEQGPDLYSAVNEKDRKARR